MVVSRAAGLPPPVDSVYPLIDDDAGLRAEAEFVRSLGFGAKSAIHPRQIPILHEAFAPSARELEWARQVLAAFEAGGRGATRLPDGEFVDLPVAQRAQRLLEIAGLQRRRIPWAPDPPDPPDPRRFTRVGTFACASRHVCRRESAGRFAGTFG